MRRLCAGALALVLVTQFGCGVIQKPGWKKPWGKGALIPAIICGAAGGGLGAWIQEERRGSSEIVVSPPGELPVSYEVEDDAEHWKGILIGVPAGALVCGVLGHVFLDPAAPPAPPPPPPSPKGEELLPGGVAVKARKRIVLRGVNFDFDRADIRPDSATVLDEAARIIVEMRDEIEQLVVEGHTDALGTDEYNKALSIRRAEAVFRYLVNQGVPPELVLLEGYGESQPVADNETEEGRAQNRRVELRVIQVKIVPAGTPEEGALPEEGVIPEEGAPAEGMEGMEPAPAEAPEAQPTDVESEGEEAPVGIDEEAP